MRSKSQQNRLRNGLLVILAAHTSLASLKPPVPHRKGMRTKELARAQVPLVLRGISSVS